MTKEDREVPRISLPNRLKASSRDAALLLLLISSIAHQSIAKGEDIRDYVKSIVGDSLIETKDCSNTRSLQKTAQVVSQKKKPIADPKEVAYADLSCLVSAQSVHTQWKAGSVLIVDVRRPNIYQQHHISGSINLSLHEIKYKQSLKERKLVLTNKGLSQRFLLKACGQLKQQGFDQVSVLEGGLNAWDARGFPLISKAGLFAAIDKISPYEYLNASPETEWLYIDLDHSSADIRSLISNARILQYTGDSSEFKLDFQKFKGSGISGLTARYLVVDQDGRNHQQYRQLLSDRKSKDIFFLSGGINALRRHMHQHVALLERQKKGFQVRMGCN